MTTETKIFYRKNAKAWKAISDWIRKKRGYKCEACGSPSIPGKILTVHHIDGKPNNISPKNLLLLCQRCHLSMQSQKIQSLEGLLYLQGKGNQPTLFHYDNII